MELFMQIFFVKACTQRGSFHLNEAAGGDAGVAEQMKAFHQAFAAPDAYFGACAVRHGTDD